MPILKKKPTVGRVTWRDRARDRIAAHPRWTWGTVAAVVGVLGVLVPWGIALEDRYQRKVDAAREAEAIRHEIKIGDARAERAQAWSRYGQARTEALVLGNRMRDCAVRVASGNKQTPMELTICREYEAEFRDADARAKEARAAAQAANKGAP
jgi:hypothetical protein